MALICSAAFVGAYAILDLAAGFLASLLWPSGADGGAGLTDALKRAAPLMLMGVIGCWMLLLVMRAAPRWGWAWLSGIVAAVVFALVLIPPVSLDPAARGDAPASGPLAAPLLDFVRKGGLNARRLYVFQSADPTAVDMEGLGPFVHAAVSRAALANPGAQTYAAIGHLLGHYRHKDLWTLALLWSVAAAAFLLAAWKAVAVKERAAPKNLPTIGLIAWGVALLTTPAFNLFDQAINYRADDYAMSLTRDPDGLSRWLLAIEAGGKADPSLLEAVVFYDHPPLAVRLRNAMRWKSAHGL